MLLINNGRFLFTDLSFFLFTDLAHKNGLDRNREGEKDIDERVYKTFTRCDTNSRRENNDSTNALCLRQIVRFFHNFM